MNRNALIIIGLLLIALATFPALLELLGDIVGLFIGLGITFVVLFVVFSGLGLLGMGIFGLIALIFLAITFPLFLPVFILLIPVFLLAKLIHL